MFIQWFLDMYGETFVLFAFLDGCLVYAIYLRTDII